ncbi:hypothetical protein, partial [Enterococcus ratti]
MERHIGKTEMELKNRFTDNKYLQYTSTFGTIVQA